MGTADILVVGGGASGTLVVVQLLRLARAPLSILWVDARGRFARGIAYRNLHPAFSLNVPSSRMGALPEDPGHFERWCRSEARDQPVPSFASRARYGDYLASVLEEAVRGAPHVSLERRTTEVQSCLPVRPQTGVGQRRRALFEAQLQDGTAHEVAQVVLATGNLSGPPPPVAEAPFWTGPRWIGAPLEEGALERVARDRPVFLWGMGLTMVDVLLALLERGCQGPFHALSRHGLLPHSHAPSSAPPSGSPASPAPWAALATASWATVRAAVRSLREAAEHSQAAGGDWRAVIDVIRPRSVAHWRGFGVREQRRFLRHARAFWDIHRHRMAPEAGARVAAARAEGRLRTYAGRIRHLSLDGDEVVVHYIPRGTGEERTLRAGTAVSCMGPAADPAAPSPLLRQMIAAGLVARDPLGLGLALDLEPKPEPEPSRANAPHPAETRHVNVAAEHVFALGPLLRGSRWETVAMPEIREQAYAIAVRLLQEHARPSGAA